jgi:hypothetical protein
LVEGLAQKYPLLSHSLQMLSEGPEE